MLFRRLLVMILCITHLCASSSAATVTLSEMRGDILKYVNEYRLTHHLKPLQVHLKIDEEASQHSQDMAFHQMPFGHEKFKQRIAHLYQKIPYADAGAENVAYYRWDAKKLVEGWIASPGHRRNLLGNYNLTGIGIAQNKKGWAYYTQIFIKTSAPMTRSLNDKTQVSRRS